MTEHLIEKTMDIFLESLPGYENCLHAESSVKKYEDCLKKNPHCFLNYMKSREISIIEMIKKEDVVQYKDFLFNKVCPNSVRPFITASRLLLQYAFRLGWLPEDLSVSMHVPKPSKPVNDKTIPPDLEKKILDGDWGINSFVVARNRLITRLVLKRGMMPKEFVTILEEHIHPYADLGFIEVFGKGGKPREVMLDAESLEALRVYMIERAHFMLKRKINCQNIFLSLIPRADSFTITTSGIQAIIRSIKTNLRQQGYAFDLSMLNSQGCRRSSLKKAYNKTNKELIRHTELTICGQHGQGIGTTPRYFKKSNYWKKDLKNAYEVVTAIEKNDKDIQKVLSESSFFNKFGLSIP